MAQTQHRLEIGIDAAPLYRAIDVCLEACWQSAAFQSAMVLFMGQGHPLCEIAEASPTGRCVLTLRPSAEFVAAMRTAATPSIIAMIDASEDGEAA